MELKNIKANKNVFIYICIALVMGAVIGYFYKDTKTIEKEVSSKKDLQTISDLQKQLSQKQKIIRLYSNGIIQSETIDTDTTENTTQQTKIIEKIVYQEKEVIKINERKYYVEVNYASDKTYGFNTHYAILNPVHVGVGVSSDFINHTVFRLGVGLNF